MLKFAKIRDFPSFNGFEWDLKYLRIVHSFITNNCKMSIFTVSGKYETEMLFCNISYKSWAILVTFVTPFPDYICCKTIGPHVNNVHLT